MGVWYRAGTVSVTNGSPAVVGVGTLWLTQASVGDIFLGPNLVEHEITAITDDTHMSVMQVSGTAAYAGTTASAQVYAIIRNFTSTLPAQLASQLAAMMTAWHVTTDELTAWLSGTGSTTVHDSVGNAYSVQTPAALNAALNGRLVKSVAGGVDVTLTSAEASNLFIELTGTLTANINVIMPAGVRHNFMLNSTAGAFMPTIKTAAGTGLAAIQGGRILLECDGTNVINPFVSMPLQSPIITTPTLVGSGGVLTLPVGPDTLVGQKYLSQILGINNLVNEIGAPGAPGFGVGICPLLAPGFTPLPGHTQPGSDSYGNYQYTDGSIMVWIPAFYYKWGTGANGFAINVVDIQSEDAYASVSAANAAGYALHRAFYDGGVVTRGFFVDKYKCSNNAGTASSIKNGNPLSSAAANNPFSGLAGAPANFYYGAIAAAKTRGANFFPGSLFIRSALAMLALAHAQASTSTTWCAWYNATSNFPKGCNNNALGDANDAALTFVSAGNGTYPTANKTGSANVLAKTTHNGQTCGVADINGTIYEICLGLTSDATNIYILKTNAAMKSLTASNTLATDAWGATGIAALYDSLGATFGALWGGGTNRVIYMGAATQVFDAATSGNAWNATGAGIPLAAGIGGTNAFGNDVIYDYSHTNEMCPLVAFSWSGGSSAGAWALHLPGARGNSSYDVGFRAALYL